MSPLSDEAAAKIQDRIDRYEDPQEKYDGDPGYVIEDIQAILSDPASRT